MPVSRMQVEKVRRDGRDLELADRTLRCFEAALRTLQEHRKLIVKAIDDIDNARVINWSAYVRSTAPVLSRAK